MTDSQPPASLLDQGDPTPISQLNPEISDQGKRVVDGTITITWPFSILNKSIAFLLAERDPRLRRENGQVRIRFHGAAAKAVAGASLGAGDEIRLSLHGATWEKNETHTQVAGSTLAWQLEFTSRLAISIRRAESEQATLLDIDSPETQPEPEASINGHTKTTEPNDISTSNPEPTTPIPQSPEVTLPVKRDAASTLDPNEYASPAFLKRARVSYGSLFEGGMDIFDDDVSRKTKSKKRSRFSLPANAWRYASQSPSPEPDEGPEEEEPQANGVSNQNGQVEDILMGTPPRPAMVDQGCQTADVDFTPMASVQILAESRPIFGFSQSTPTPLPRTRPFGADSPILSQTGHLQGETTTPHDAHHADLLGPSPGHIDTGMAFDFTPQTVLFPHAPGFFPSGHAQDAAPESPSRATGAEDYPAELLDADGLLPNIVNIHSGPASHMSHTTAAPPNPFVTAPIFHTTFSAINQPPQIAGGVRKSSGPHSAAPSTDAENPMEILSSRESSVDRQSYPSREDTDRNTTANASPEPDLEELASTAEHYRDGGDEPGDDYDLRQYSRTHDDDDDVETSEEEPDINNDDPDTQIMNPEEDDADFDEYIGDQEEEDFEAPDEYEEEIYAERFQGKGGEYDRSEDDAEGYSDEESYYDEEGGEEEEDVEPRPSAAPISQEPVFISLLSDSEDEDEPATKPESKPEPEMDSESEEESEPEQAREPENKQEPEQLKEHEPLLVPELKDEPEDAKTDEEMVEAECASPSQPKAKQEPPCLKPEEEDQIAETEDANGEQMSQQEPESESKDEIAEMEDVNNEEMAQPENDQAPPSSAEETIAYDAKAAHVPAVPEADKAHHVLSYAQEAAEVEQPSVDANDAEVASVPALSEADNADSSPHSEQVTKEDQPSTDLQAETQSPGPEEQPRHEGEDEAGKPIEAEGEPSDIDMDHAPVLEEELEQPKDNIAEEERIRTNSPDETNTAIVEAPTAAMDLDRGSVVAEEHAIEPTEITVNIIDTNITVSHEFQGTITETSANDEVVLIQEEVLAQPRDTPDNDVELSHVPTVGDAVSRENVDALLDDQEVAKIHKSQSSEPAEVSETIVQDTIVEVTAQAESQPTDASNRKDDAEESNINVQLATEGQISPPPTQASQAQTLEHDSIVVSNNRQGVDVPTLGETQHVMEVEMIDTFTTIAHDDQADEDEAELENQIKAEILQHSPIRQDTRPSTNPAMSSPATSQPKSPSRTGLTDEPLETPENSELLPETAAAKSLRSRRRKPAKSPDHGEQEDPSIALISATPPSKKAGSNSKHSSPAGPGSKARSKTTRDDPSIQLAGGSAHSGGKNKRKRKATDDESIASLDTSSPGSQRVLRPRHDHGDPSILLAKASSPSTRQTRSHKTPDPKRETPRRETRSVSRSFQLREESPNVSFASLKSPSIAGSTTTVPEEEDVKTLKLQLSKSLRTNLPDLLSLKNLSGNSLDKMADVLAVATATPPHPHRPKHGPRDYMLTLSLTDPSTAPTQVRVAQLFRPHIDSLPDVEAGDVVLLRRFKVVSMKGRGFGVRSEDSSSWAVSKGNGDEILGQVKGPPVEIAKQEIEYAKGLRHWWSSQDASAMDKIKTASRKVAEAGKDNTK
ncbi:hypothetical protein F66182_4111 [Fusarium sp. NRRL 66182]|nr:hypothetical protein F66182_4111 [Fusarium sp. NRRL 66182]